MYCSNDNNSCRELATLIRRGLPFTYFFGLEDLFYKYGVDVEIWAHQHSYERLWPIYNYTVLNGSYNEPYRNPMAPVHLVTGSAGCKEGHANFVKDVPVWSAFHSTVSLILFLIYLSIAGYWFYIQTFQDYGYTRMKANNRTHLYFEQVSDDQDGAVIDSMWIIKDEPLPRFMKRINDIYAV